VLDILRSIRGMEDIWSDDPVHLNNEKSYGLMTDGVAFVLTTVAEQVRRGRVLSLE
jgi:hypothetical protein